MAHNYIVQSATYIADPTGQSDPQVTIVGSVDGEPVTVYCYLSQVPATQAAQKTLAAALMLLQAQKQIAARTPTVTSLPTGAFSQ